MVNLKFLINVFQDGVTHTHKNKNLEWFHPFEYSLTILTGLSSQKFINIDRRLFIQIDDDVNVFWTFEQFRKKKRGNTSSKFR